MKKRLPKMKTNKEAEELLAEDLSDYIDKENFVATTFEFAPKDKSINLRLSEDLLKAIKSISKHRGMSYQKYIREALEKSLKRDAA